MKQFVSMNCCSWKADFYGRRPVSTEESHFYGGGQFQVCNWPMGSQAGVVDINHAFHLYYKCCMWIEFQSIST